MLFALICTDKPGGLPVRQAHRPKHLSFLQSLGTRLVLAGPFTAADNETMNGSLIVVEADSLEAAQKIAEGDPFATEGLFASVEIRPWKLLINNSRESA